MARKSSPSPRNAGVRALALVVATVAAAAPVSAAAPPAKSAAVARRTRVADTDPRGLAGLVARIQANAERIRRLTFLFQAPGFPREDPVRAALIRENQDLMLRVERASGALLDPIRKDPPPGQWAWWQLLRDAEQGAHAARLLGDYEFRDATIARRFAVLAAPPDATRKPSA